MSAFTITQTPNSKFAYLYPTGNGCDINCFPFGDVANWKCVDDAHNSLTPDETYVFMNGASTVSETYRIENHGTLTGTINYVKGCCRAKSDQFPPAYNFDYRVILSKDNACTDFALSRIMPLSTGFTTFENAWSENPFTSAEWSWGEIDAVQVGFEASSPSVVMATFALKPLGAGDRTDITDVTEGYEHWEAVLAERPLAQVSEDGAAWKYDLYEFTMASSDYYIGDTDGAYSKYGDYAIITSFDADKTYIYKWENNGKLHLLAKNNSIGGDGIANSGSYYYIIRNAVIYVLKFDATDNTLTEVENVTIAPGVFATGLLRKDDYLYVAYDDTAMKIYKIAIDGTLTYITQTTTNTYSISSYGNYIYGASTGGTLTAYSFDGTTLTEIDNIGCNNELCTTNEDGYIFTSGNDRLQAFSFDGTTLVAIDSTVAPGNMASIQAITCTGKYIHLIAQGADYGLHSYSFDGANLSFICTYADIDHEVSQMSGTDGFVFTRSSSNTGLILSFNGAAYSKVRDVADGMLPKHIDDNIESVTVIAKMGKEYDADDEADIRGRATIKTHANEYPMTDYWKLEYPKKWYAHTWETNPNTSAAWTLDEIRNLQAGVGLYGTGTKYAACSVCHVILTTSSLLSPEIQTSNAYLKINYTPPASSCSLIRPEEISYDHSRNVKMLNFWNGDREVYDLSRNNKTMVLTGTQCSFDACDVILCVRNMGLDGSIVALSGLGFAEFNGDFRIRSFGWNKISDKPLHYKYILELEDSEL